MDYSNLVSLVNNTLSSLLDDLLLSVDSNVFSLLDKLVFLDGSILHDQYFNSFFTNNFSIISLSRSFLYGLLIYYAISKLFSYITSSNYQKTSSFLFRLFLSAIFIHFSPNICEYILDFFGLSTEILRSIGNSLFSVKISFSLFYEKASSLLLNGKTIFWSFDGIIRSFMSVGFISLLLTYSVRYVFVRILILMAPFAFLSFSLEQSTWIFKIWLKNFIGQLFVQLFICIILIILFSFQKGEPTLTKLLYMAILTCLIKANSFVKDFTSGFTSDITSSFNQFKNSIL